MRLSVTKGNALAYCKLLACPSLSVQNSGRKIIEILKKNPSKEPEKYDEEDLGHMRKVVSVRLCTSVYLVLIDSLTDRHEVLQASSRPRREGQTRYE